MQILTEQQQIDVLRNRCENAQTRIWIASPYIGSLKDVQKIIGGKWLLPSVDCKILTDIDFGFIRQDTFDEFISNQMEVRSLDSFISASNGQQSVKINAKKAYGNKAASSTTDWSKASNAVYLTGLMAFLLQR